jgi:type I restriction enzyme, S subunit
MSDDIHGYVPLKKIADIIMGQSPPSNTIFETAKGLPFLQGSGEFGPNFPEHKKWCSVPLKVSNAEDILVSVRAPVGELNKTAQSYCIGRGLGAIRFRTSITSNYGWYLLSYWIDDLRKSAQGSTFDAIKRKDLENLLTHVLQFQERPSVTKILNQISESIQKTDSLIIKLQNIRVGLIHDLLSYGSDENGNFRNPINCPENFDIDEKYGLKPVEWKIQKIDEIKANSANALAMGPFGSNITVKNFVPSGIPVIRGVNLAGFAVDFTDAVFIKERKAKELRASNIFWNDIVITHRGTVGQVSLFKENSPFNRAVVSQSQLKITCDKNKMLPEFLTLFLKSEFGQRLINNAKAHTGVQAIGQPLSTIREMRVPVPSVPEQQKIVIKIFSLDDLIKSEELNHNKLIKIKQGLMQDLLTGRVPLSENLLTAQGV